MPGEVSQLRPSCVLGGWDGVQGGSGLQEARHISAGVKMGSTLQRDGGIRPCDDVPGDRLIEHPSVSRLEGSVRLSASDRGWCEVRDHGRDP